MEYYSWMLPGHWLDACNSLVSLNIGENVQVIPDNFVCGRYSLVGALTIPNSVTSIGENAFSGCSGLASVNIGNSVTSIEDAAFSGCSNLASVSISNSVTSIGEAAFSGCSNLTSVSIPNSVTSIGEAAFSGCSSLASISLPNSITLIEDVTFHQCTSLASIVIPESVVSIGSHVFYQCTNLASATIGNSVSSIGYGAFYECTALSSVTIPNSVVSIGTYAFSYCYDLTSLSIGNAVVSIGENAFYGCSNLAQIQVNALTPPALSNNAFYNVPTSIPVYVPCGHEQAYTSVNWGGFSNIMGVCAGEIAVTANPAGGGTVSGGGSYEGGATCTLTATSYGYLPFLNWTKDGEVVSTNPTYSFIVTGDASYVANFGQVNVEDFQIGSGTATNQNLPSNSYYDYTLSQQIYTAGEMGGMAGTISSIAFYNGGSEKTRSYDIYLKHTTKSSFSNNSDWITVSASDKVFSGDVTLPVGEWTTITFDTPFNYDGVNNLALIVDDNTGSYSNSPHMSCRVFDADGYQALYKYDDGTNYNPYNPSSISGTRLSVKNQIKLEIASTTGTNIEFADEAVKTLCVANWDTDGDGELSYVEAASVTDLGDVFKNNTTITSFDELQCFTGLTSIGEWAFGHCSSLTSIVIPNTTTFIGNSAFSCSGLTSITIPYSVNNIHTWAFDVCSELEQIVVASDNAVYDSRDNCNAIIKTASNTLIVGCKTTIIPSTVTSIGNSAFYGRNSLTSINIPDSVTSIGGYAFYGCSGLTSIDIPHSVTSIGSYAFNGCSALTSMTIMADVPPTLSGNAVFGYVNKSIPVYVPCGFVESYQNAEGWVFTNFVGMCPVAITATPNPTAGGTVTGAGTFNAGETCTLTATANEGYSFINWTLGGEDVSTEPTYSFTVTEASAFVANFELNSYAITATANPAAGGVTTGAGTYDHGATATLTATANVGYTFINWTKDGEEVSNSSTYSFTVTEVSAFVANFEMNSYVITAEASPTEGGTVAGGGTYDHGTTATMTATANTGYHFANWTKDGTVVSTNATYSFAALENASFVAHFELNSYVVTATANPTVGGTVTGGGTYYHMEAVTLTATPNMGYRFVNWTKDGTAISASQTLGFMVTEDADYVANFETCSYNITALANPSVGGTVSGAGAYEFGETATLTAMPNANYAFVNWTENGVEVSTEAIYSFIVEGSRSLVANFSHDYYWTVNPFAHESTMTIIGIVQINGEEQHSNLLEVGAFSGEECRGREWLTDQYYVDFGHYLVFLTVYGDNDSADEITFRLYDHAANEEVDKTCVTTLAFETDAIYGSHADPFAINFIDANITQTANLSNGWNWWSSFIELDGENSLQNLENSLGTNGMMIKSQNDGYASYLEGFGWYGSLTTINNESTYQIRANEACTVEMTGSVANPAEHPIELHSGWTWIGYPVAVSMGVEDALAGIEPLSGDMLKSQNNGFASYLEGFGWYGSLSILDPGMGLMYKSNNSSPITLVYPNNGTRNDLKANQTADNNHWQPNLNTYPDNMSVMAVVELDGNELEGENYELAAFANGEVRGSARLLYVEPLNRYMAFLTVAGDEAAELRFGLYNTETGEVETQCITSLQYETNAVIGSFAEPYVVRFRGTTGVDEWANSLNVFPNPVERGQKVSLGFNDVEMGEVQVEIINVLGTIVETRRAASLQTITAPETAGVYTLRITVEGKGTCYRKLVVE